MKLCKIYHHNIIGVSFLLTLVHIFNTFQASAYYIVVDPDKSDCYHEYATARTKLGFSFEVLGETANNIDVTIKDPKLVVVHHESNIDLGKYTIEAGLDGNYEFCFTNSASKNLPRYIMFSIDESKPADNDTNPDSEEKKIADMMRGLLSSALSTKHEASYLVARDRIHQKVSESTNSLIIRWIFFEAILLLAVSLAQVYFMRRFFEKRRRV